MSDPSDRTFHLKKDERELKMHLLAGIVTGAGQNCRFRGMGRANPWIDIYSAYKQLSRMLRDVQDDAISATDFQNLWAF